MPRWLGMAAFASLPIVLFGCASTGPPRPPSLHLPQAVTRVSAQRSGDRVDITFTVPTLSTDHQMLAGKHGAGTLTAEVCRIDHPGALCTALNAQQVTPGQDVALQDALPPALRHGPPYALHYVVHVLNGQGRSSADSRETVAVAGMSPEPLRALAAATVARGVQLSWKAAPVERGTHLQIEADTSGNRRLLTVDGDPGGTVDVGPKTGQTVTYTVFRSRALPGAGPAAAAHGEPATVTITRAPDTFPPAVPTGLAAVAMQLNDAATEIDLSWNAGTEPDLAGYLVERVEEGSTVPPSLLTPAPIATASYRDAAVLPGRTYRYTVRAVDAAGNRSQPSAAATESLRP